MAHHHILGHIVPNTGNALHRGHGFKPRSGYMKIKKGSCLIFAQYWLGHVQLSFPGEKLSRRTNNLPSYNLIVIKILKNKQNYYTLLNSHNHQ